MVAAINVDSRRPSVLLLPANHLQNCRGAKDIVVNAAPKDIFEDGAGLQRLHEALAGLLSKPAVPPLSEDAGLGEMGTSAVQAVTRRLSRETAAFCSRIEQEAKRLESYIRPLRTERVLITGAEWLDAYTIRILASALRLAQGHGPSIVLIFSHNPLQVSTVEEDALEARRVLWSGFFTTIGLWPDFATALPGLCLAAAIPRGVVSWDQAKANISQAIGHLAYDRALCLIRLTQDQALSANRQAELDLLRATIHANLGNKKASHEILQKAISSTDDPVILSRLHYCLGLIFAKRKDDLDKAAYHFETGKNIISGSSLTDPAIGAIELSWQDNGLALLDSMRAQRTLGEVRQHLLNQAMTREKQALQRIEALQANDADYLRFNLLANCTFLFEMQGKPREAIRLFQQVFGTQNAEAVDHPRFRMNYNYRIGVLLLKAGEAEKAVMTLKASLAAAVQLADDHQETRIGLALSQALASADRMNEAQAEIQKYARITTCRSDKEMSHNFAHLEEYFADGGCSAKHLPPLSPKLPAYVPLVDLLGVPKNDINKKLAAFGQPVIA